MSSVVAKFRVVKLTKFHSWQDGQVEATQVNLAAVQGEPFGKATPSGQVEMVILNPAAAEAFRLGAEYFVTFSQSTDPKAD